MRVPARSRGMVLAGRILLLTTVALLSSCGGGGDGGITTPTTVAVASVELSASTLELAPNATQQLNATARSSSGTALGNRSFTWTSASPAVATVSASGLVTGVAEGSTSVTVTSEGKSASAAVTVRSPVASVAITPNTAQLTAGGAATQLAAVARDANGVALANRTIDWSSSNVAVASVSQTGVVTGVAAGTATITASSEGRSGTANITVAAANPCLSVRAVTVGSTFSGTLASTDCRLTDNSVLQKFSFTVATTQVLEIEMTSTAVDAYLFVLDANETASLVEDDDGGTGSNARVLRSFAPGKYIVVANSYFANTYGDFQLSVKPAPTACATDRPIGVPSSTNSALNVINSCLLNDKSFIERYGLTVNARSTVRLDMTSAVLDPFMLLLDASGNLVAQDDDGGTGLNARIEVQLEAGKYFLLANAQPGQTGTYRLDVAIPADPCAVTRTISISQTTTSTLTAADCALATQGPIPFTQRWLLNVPASQPLLIDMVSSAVDAYLVLQNATTGAVLAENDDISNASTNARISANFPAGQYIVNATTYDYNETGPYSLTVTPIAPSTPVSVSVSPSVLSMTSGGQQLLAASVSGSANTAVTWSTSATAVATVSTSGLVRAVTPGTATITARSVADPSKTFNVPVTVTQTQSGIPNLDIAAMYVIQSVQQLDGSVQLVANRDAVARVFLRGSRTGIGNTTVRIRAYQGSTVLQTFETTVTPALTVDEGCCTANIPIPANLIRSGVSLLADADPLNLITESNETDNLYPLNGTAMPLNVTAVPDFNVRLVPIRQNRSGLTGVASNSVLNTLRSLWPLATVNVTTRGTLAVDYELVSTSFDEWSLLVRDLETKRRGESSNMYYYGLVRVNYTSGVLGLAGGIPALSAVGVDEGSSFGPTEAKFTLAHEMGHTIGLRHAPCGGAAGPDPAFPYSDGRSGAYGLDIASGNVVKLPNGTDIMGYCENQWVSVYNYRNVFDLRARNPNGVPAAIATGAKTSVLMVTGSVNANAAHIDGSFALDATANKNDPAGRFVLEGFGSDGKVLFAHRFSPFAVSDSKPDDEAFVVGIPVSESLRAQVVRVAVREVNGARKDSRSKSAALAASAASPSASALFSATRAANGAVQLQWSKATAPMVMVRDPATGEILGIGRTGTLDLTQFQSVTDVEVLLTDGATSIRRTANTRTGVLRQ